MSTFGKIGARNLVWKPPYDAEVEYLESTGEEYIDTGFRISSDGSVPDGAFVECKYRTTTRNGKAMYITSRFSAANWSLTLGDYANAKPDVYFGVSLNSAWGNIGSPTNAVTTVRADMSGALINGVKYSFSYPSTLYLPTRTIYLFAQHTADSVGTKYVVYIYGFSINGADGFMDLIPVRCGQVGYMFDRANIKGGPLGNGLYPNAGTGEFVLGPDKMGGGVNA